MALLRAVHIFFALVVLVNAMAAYKRARPAMADLEMLMHDYSQPGPEGSRLVGNYENLETILDTLKKLHELDKIYSHQARPR